MRSGRVFQITFEPSHCFTSGSNLGRRAGARLSGIADLQRMKDSLLKLIRKCGGHGATKGCPILDALQGSGADPTEQ